MITIDYNPNIFEMVNGKLTIKISKEANNGLHLDDNGNIVPKKGNSPNTSGGFYNKPGNSVDGEVGKAIHVVRLNNSVSRKTAGDPTTSNEGVLMSDVLTHIFGGA